MRLHRFLFFLLMASAVAAAQSTAGPFTISSASSPCARIKVTGQSTVGIQVTGSFSMTLQPEVSISGQAAANTQVTPSTSSTAQSTITAAGVFSTSVSGYDDFLLCVTAYTSGTATIYLNSTKATAGGNGGSGGSGSGTVSANNGSVGALAVYAAAGGSTTVGPDATLTDNGASLTYSGTQGLALPNGAQGTPSLRWASPGSGVGWSEVSPWLIWGNGAQDWFGINSSSPRLGFNASLALCWMPGNNIATGAVDTCATRSAAGMVAVGTTSTVGDETGLLRVGNACHVTADITLPVNTATTVCTWSLPALAKAWAWQCQIPWAITAGTGTNTLAIIANPSQTPTAATNGSAEIKTTNTNTATELTTAISASGGTTLLTSGTITPGATVFMSSTSGTLLASATAGTFAIQMTAAGTTATAAAKAGATCLLY